MRFRRVSYHSLDCPSELDARGRFFLHATQAG
jgi:hypothetical protein